MSHRLPTKAQLQALKRLYDRSHPAFQSFVRFRRNAFWAYDACLMVPWAGMIVGIEPDGYTHS